MDIDNDGVSETEQGRGYNNNQNWRRYSNHNGSVRGHTNHNQYGYRYRWKNNHRNNFRRNQYNQRKRRGGGSARARHYSHNNNRQRGGHQLYNFQSKRSKYQQRRIYRPKYRPSDQERRQQRPNDDQTHQAVLISHNDLHRFVNSDLLFVFMGYLDVASLLCFYRSDLCDNYTKMSAFLANALNQCSIEETSTETVGGGYGPPYTDEIHTKLNIDARLHFDAKSASKLKEHFYSSINREVNFSRLPQSVPLKPINYQSWNQDLHHIEHEVRSCFGHKQVANLQFTQNLDVVNEVNNECGVRLKPVVQWLVSANGRANSVNFYLLRFEYLCECYNGIGGQDFKRNIESVCVVFDGDFCDTIFINWDSSRSVHHKCDI